MEDKEKKDNQFIVDKLIDKLDLEKQHQHPLFRSKEESEKLVFNKMAPLQYEYPTYEQQQRMS